MTDRPRRFEPGHFEHEDRRADDLAPEVNNSEQDEDAEEQAQTVAEEARERAGDLGLEDSEKVKSSDLGDDSQDLVDHMRQMDSSGHIDMDAYEGEPNHDDNVDKLGPASKVDKKLRGDGT